MTGIMKIVLLAQTGTNEGNLCHSVTTWEVQIQLFKYHLSQIPLCLFQLMLVS